MNLFIDNYNFGIKSVFCSEYGLRHWEKAKSAHGLSRLAHRVIGAVECFPVLGHVVSLIEGIMHACFSTPRPLGATPTVVKKDSVSTNSDSSMIPNSTIAPLPVLTKDDEEEEFDYEDDGRDPLIGIQQSYLDNPKSADFWFVPFLGFCLLTQPKILRDAIRESAFNSYPLLQFVWIQWALATHLERNAWDHIPTTNEADDNGISLQKGMQALATDLHPNELFVPYIFSEEEIKKLLSSKGNIIEFFTQKNETDLPNKATYIGIAKNGQTFLKQEFSQFSVVKEALTKIFPC